MSFEEYLAFDDVLMLPKKSSVTPDKVNTETNLTKTIKLAVPLVSAAMDTVTDSKLAIALAEEGGIGIIHRNMNIEEQVAEVRKVKQYQSEMISNPITASSNDTVSDIRRLMALHNISGVPIVDDTGLLIGLVTSRDLNFENDPLKKIYEIMITPDKGLIVVFEDATTESITKELQQHRIEKMPIVDEKFHLKGLVTYRDIQKAREKPNATRDESGRLRVGAAVGTTIDTLNRVNKLVDASVDVIVIDSAHGHSENVMSTLCAIKKQYPLLQIIVGNVATNDGAIALCKCGADAIKVGMGPGSICTTRVVTGVGVPQFSAILKISQIMRLSGFKDVPIIADGGIKYSGDMCKALGAGASSIMAGSMFAGTEESPGDLITKQGQQYKTYRGMGSLGAMNKTTDASDRYFHKTGSGKSVPEGVEACVPYKGPLRDVVAQLTGGLKSSMGYLGASNLQEYKSKAEFIKVTNSGLIEGHVHDVTITREPPNYS